MLGKITRFINTATKFRAPLGVALSLYAVFLTVAVRADEGVEAAGKNRFMDYCAVCHGQDARGGGPFANVLKAPPPDLTVLSKNADGTFPFDRIYAAIDGRDEMGSAHGTKDMPIWGGEWKGSSVVSETALRGRILEMIIFLRSVQQ